MRQKQDPKNNQAVSPVIGVILMVAITVILAAVIGVFVLGLGGDVGPTPQLGVQLDYSNSSDTLDVTVIDPGNVDKVSFQPSGLQTTTNGGTIPIDPVEAGKTVTLDLTTGSVSSGDTVSIVGTVDGEDTVVRTFTIP